MMKPLKQAGYSLVELMVVVLLMALLMAVAIPGYRGYTQRAHRSDATIQLMRVAAQQERFYVQNGTYASNALLTTAQPAGLGFSGISDRGDYDISTAAGPGGLAVAYTVSATPAAGGTQTDDTACTSFELNQNGLRGANGAHVPADVDECWR